MRQAWAICLFEIRRVLKQRKSWMLMFVMPIVFAMIFGGLSGGGEAAKTKLALVDEDRTAVSQEVVQTLSANETLAITVTSGDEAQTLLQDQKVAGVLTVPHGLEQCLVAGATQNVRFQHGPDLAVAATISQAMDDALAQEAVHVQAARLWSEGKGVADWQGYYVKLTEASKTPAVTVDAQAVTRDQAAQQLTGSTYSSIGFSIMFLMMSMMSVTGTILEARKNGVWYRMMSTPLTRLNVLGGYMLSFFFTGWIQFGVLMVASSVLFGVEWGNMPALIVLVSAMMLCVVGLGLFIAGFVKTTEQQSTIGSIVIISTCMLGGLYWPLDIVSDTMRKIAEFVPQSWAMEGFTEVVARGGTLGDIGMQVAVLLAFAAVFLIGGLSRVRYE